MYGYVYETTNKINGKKYIGQHRSRIFDIHYKGSGLEFKKALAEYGFDNFETHTLVVCYNRIDLLRAESLMIRERNAVVSENYYNTESGLHLEDISKNLDQGYGKVRTSRVLKIRKYLIDMISNQESTGERVLNLDHFKYRYGINQYKARQNKIRKYGSLTGAMMTPEVRKRAGQSIALSKSIILEYHGEYYLGLRALESYLRNNDYPKIVMSTLRLMIKGRVYDKYLQLGKDIHVYKDRDTPIDDNSIIERLHYK